jgi:serine/threonine-protein kinase
MYKTKFHKGQRFGRWQLEKFIKAGGNGEVWRATDTDDSSRVVAIKLLKRIDNKGYVRFRDEIKVLKENVDIKGLLEIIDYNLPENPKDVIPWYVMPLATPLTKYIEGKLPDQIVDIIISVCGTLIDLHSRCISHRDIKPANILVKDDTIYLSDFGLVEYPGKKDITPEWNDVGPRWTSAPEMRRNPDTADGKLADVYSIAKTLWILLTKEKKGFEGQYTVGSSIEIKKFVPSIYCIPLNNLIHRSTDHDPKKRPSIKQFADELSEWKELNKDFEKRSKSEWLDIQNSLFPSAMPRTVIWENIDDIITILNVISEHGQVNHTLLPGGGGLDLEGAKLSYEEGCIEVNLDGFAYIVRPKQLVFECFKGHSDWNYFRLETEGLELIGKYDDARNDELLTEIRPCVYTNYRCFEFDDFNGERLLDSARQVLRIKRGAFLICLRTGIYNRTPETYDGRHDKVSVDKFRNYIEKNIRSLEGPKDEVMDKEHTEALQFKKPRFVESTKIRRGSRVLKTDEIRLLGKVIRLFRQARKEGDNLRREIGLDSDGLGIDFFNEKTREAMSQYDKAPKPCNEKFEQFLKSLSDDHLALIETVMYGGRDALTMGRAHPLDEMLAHFEKDDRDSQFFSISEKASLDEYLLAGIKAYK